MIMSILIAAGVTALTIGIVTMLIGVTLDNDTVVKFGGVLVGAVGSFGVLVGIISMWVAVFTTGAGK